MADLNDDRIDDLENFLMKDDEDGAVVDDGFRTEWFDGFFAAFGDSLGDGSAEIADVSGDKEKMGSLLSPRQSEDGGVEAAKVGGANGGDEADDPASKKLRMKEKMGRSDDGGVEAAKVGGANGGNEAGDPVSKKRRRRTAKIANLSGDKEKMGRSDDGGVEAAKVGGANGGDPASKKRERQLRNREAAVRLRERKKEHVRYLELKNEYLEGECRKLRKLQENITAEKNALCLKLKNCTCGANAA